LAGAVHLLAPDHWFPASILAWRRGWRLGRTLTFLLLAYSAHVALGAAVYFAFREFLTEIGSSRLLPFTIVLICVLGLARSIRFDRVEEIFRSDAGSPWRIWTVLALLGPSESLIPILIKSQQTGISTATTCLAFLGGTLASGAALAVMGRIVWDRPEALARWLSFLRGRMAAAPVAGFLAVGLVFLLRLS
jgi:hypothetical protein